MRWQYDDGGRAAAGYKGDAGDCVVRAIAIAAQLPYEKVYADLKECRRIYMTERNDAVAKRIAEKGTSPRNGNSRAVYELYLAALGYVFTPTMQIGQGCRVHMCEDELPAGRIIVRLSKHLAAVVDGVVHDSHDCTRGGARCVYGYYAPVR